MIDTSVIDIKIISNNPETLNQPVKFSWEVLEALLQKSISVDSERFIKSQIFKASHFLLKQNNKLD
jgi:hypothetical protein